MSNASSSNQTRIFGIFSALGVGMKSFITSLCLEHRALARDLWQALYHAPDTTHLVAARHAFDNAPDEVRAAILRASIQSWRDENSIEAEKNPFD
ncbi:MAG: hypothetical protein EOO38_03310 [Cytophagaceae bacterium]|nr:MAG: hypothetical protein EOO38_03310 [Cytophagaceae bacterium]